MHGQFQKRHRWHLRCLLRSQASSNLFSSISKEKSLYQQHISRRSREQDLYARMPEILANALHASIAADANADPYLKPLPWQEWQVAIASLLPPEEIKP